MIIKVKGILNVWPSTELSNDFCNFEVLTASHFLIGRSINAIPKTMLIDTNINRSNRW